jgi:hypothetical protein
MGSDQTRGRRNNNPLNIRYTERNNWKGKIKPPNKTDNSFEEFIDVEHGLRAALINIRTYIQKYKRNTINQIVTKWAPAADGNDTLSYITHVSQMSGFPENQSLTFSKDDMYPVVKAMAWIESLLKIDKNTFDRAWDLI